MDRQIPRSSSTFVDLPGGRGYPLCFGAIVRTPEMMAEAGILGAQLLLVTDGNVAEHYLDSITSDLERAGWRVRSHIVAAGEASKSARVLSHLYDWALEEPLDRETPVLALGGGVVGDLAGYCAATLLRGLPLVQIPSSLIAQVDSSIGGKTGVNHARGKNLIGVFHQPRLVVTDTALLATLPEREFTSGLAEVVKHALIADEAFVSWLEARWPQVLSRDESTLAEMVRRAATIKGSIVRTDEREAGKRMLLNFGHTFAHALELAFGFDGFTHGEAVAVGMRAALHLSCSRAAGGVHRGSALPEPFARADRLVARIPVKGRLGDVAVSSLVEAMEMDKKRTATRLRFVVLDEPGQARVANDVPRGAVEAAWEFALSVNRP